MTDNTQKQSNPAKFDVLLIITGGIAAYKTCDLVREFRRQKITFEIVMTENAKRFITELSLSGLTGKTIHTDLFYGAGMDHINLSRLSKLIVVCPATANFIAKVAHGFSDDLASSLILASDKPLMFFPAMNPKMYGNPLLQENLKKLKKLGHFVIKPIIGEVACLEYGLGKLPAIDRIISEIKQKIDKK